MTDLSIVNIYIEEVQEELIAETVPKNFTERVSKGFITSLNDIKSLTINMLIFIIGSIPYIVVLIIILIIILSIYRIIKNRKIKRKVKKKKIYRKELLMSSFFNN